MKKIVSLLVLVILCLNTLPLTAYAEYIYGSTNGSKTFYIRANSTNASLVLNSYQGVVSVSKALGNDKYEDQHGFYQIKLEDDRTCRSVIWAPSATTNTSGINTCKQVQIHFDSPGDYSLTISPLSNQEAAQYWYFDKVNYWVKVATWDVDHIVGCSVSSVPPSTTPPQPVPSQSPVWDTFFKPGSCLTDNASAINRLDRLHDGNPSTIFHYLIWKSEWSNREFQPQFTVYFTNGTVSGISLINGNATSNWDYQRNARVRVMKIVVYSDSGVFTHQFNVPDIYSQSYQNFEFGRQYNNVNKVEIHITGTHDGTESKNNICIGDMQLY